jgi:hypothetical protein
VSDRTDTSSELQQEFQFTDSDELFPTALDRPNWPGGADLYLGRFQF